jgi:hypothetical protein
MSEKPISPLRRRMIEDPALIQMKDKLFSWASFTG